MKFPNTSREVFKSELNDKERLISESSAGLK